MRAIFAILGVLALLLGMVEPAAARHRMSFSPGGHHRYAGYHRARHGYARHPPRRGAFSRHGRPGRPAAAAPGKVPPGFQVIDGVLTYPAPARFQPKNLKGK